MEATPNRMPAMPVPRSRVIACIALLAWAPAGLAASAGRSAPVGPVAPTLVEPIERALDAAQRTPGAFPAVSAVIVQGDAAPWIHVRGDRRVD